jgi:hypothetical protein
MIVMATALFHTSGYPEVTRAIDRAELPQFLASGFKGLWLMFSVNLLLLAGFALFQAIRLTPASRLVLLLCGTVLMANTFLLFVYAGAFVGAFMLAAGSGAVLLGGASMQGRV